MKAVILAGGFGKRLKPITDNRPKPMIEILGKPIIEWQIRLLSKNNIREIIICVGYLKEQIINHIASGNKFNVNVAYMVEEEPLGTGGALKNTQSLLKDEKNGFFMINGDILTNLDFSALSHKNEFNSLAVVPLRSPFGIVDFNEQLYVTGFKEKPNILDKWINAGVYFFNQEIFNYLPDKGNIETTALPAMANEQKLKAKKFEKSFWKSIDSHKDIEESSKELAKFYPK
ncbi:nucleotidyltransferase family protein [Candidatus Nitrosocosmicus franklandus]|uniref:D-glycero-alpha-D-manno-heptose 1-phosphate guanylyltransferase n=1 Tax=Candidatus Nitrosocosmicus franklandianus TaxID=1798806 RepID=A0A484IF66_9ARCH|nr:nucleotidyltransferase family protein [Candidatus Nitrosocosmicus franklandus]VFJ15477.1 D-glycero-alpha-D-manno-heptose 1-phosphate guanylyltransferase [Candidatus Nitrosocosmicus franklandus]